MGYSEHADPIDVTVGARIRVRRREVGMSQETLAQHLGVTYQQVQKYESGANRISASMLVRTARALDCPGAFLLGASAAPGRPPLPQEDALQAELNSLLSAPGAVELLRAFVRIADAEARAGVIAIVKGLAPEAWRARR